MITRCLRPSRIGQDLGRARVQMAVLAALAVVAVACGGGADGSAGTGSASAPVDRQSDADIRDGVTEDAFPVTIEHKFGVTEIAEEPQRVVALGFQEQDAILALGVDPVAVRYWYGDESAAVFPWAVDQLGDADPEILNMPPGELDFERIAALEPDLISGVYSGITAEEYNTLAQIAPTLAQTGDYIDYGTPWQEQTLAVGRALGREGRAQELVADLEARFDAIREQHPEFDDTEIAVVTPDTGDGYGFFASQDLRARFFTALGFVIDPALEALTGNGGADFYGTISAERLELFDTDLLVWTQLQFAQDGQAGVADHPLVRQLDAVRDGRVVYVDQAVDDALAFNSVLSLPLVLDELVPQLAVALDGEQAAGAFPRTVDHAMGSTDIPARPEGVVVLDTGELDSALTLGVTPVGAVTTDVDTGFLSYLQDVAADVEVVGTIGEPNLEAIAALSPDLILSNKVRHEDLYGQLSRIAPTVFAERVGAVWKDNLRLAAEALGLEQEAAAALDAYERDAAVLGEAVGDPAGTVIVPLRFVEGTIRVYSPESFIGTVLTDTGLGQLEDLPPGQFAAFSEISAEQLQLVDGADIIVYSSFGQAADSGETDVVAGPLWEGLPAVQADQAFAVDDDVFFSGIGLTAAELMLDQLADHLGV